MARDRVQVLGHVARPVYEVWAVVRDFCGPWHPLIATMRAERGGLIRAFAVTGEDTFYREQLTWLSDSDRTLGYTHLEGIAGCEAYDARIAVSAADKGGAVVTWTATIAAPSARLAGICEGTKAIFEMGIAALATASPAPGAEVPDQGSAPPETIILDNLPRLALSVTPEVPGDALVVFLHGIGGGRQNWLAQQMTVGGLMRSVALDLRGYGGSTLGARQSSVEDYCDDILRVKSHFGAARLVLVGLSYGSWIATSFAMRYPQMLAGLVLSGGCTGMSEAGPDEREAFRISREVPLNAGQTPADFAPAVVNVLAGPNADLATRAALAQSMAAIPAATYRDALLC
ncbi:MAG: hypothetical protein B7Y02_03210, partial [Rhodobacterales bacterium 17-64-5]